MIININTRYGRFIFLNFAIQGINCYTYITMEKCKHFHIQFIQKTANLLSLCLSSSFSVFALLLQGKEFVTDSNHLLANV